MRSHGQSLIIGKFLSPEEREQVYDDLLQALTQVASTMHIGNAG
jgi:uncharacterized membrane protein